MLSKTILFLAALLLSNASMSQIKTFNWATGNGEATKSTKYRVFAQIGTQPEVEVSVLQSDVTDTDWMAEENTGRTFSYANLNYNPDGGVLKLRIVKNFGAAATSATTAPRSYNFKPWLAQLGVIAGKQVTVDVTTNQKYFSVNFNSDDNKTTKEKWIKHMLTIFVDPPETGAPSRTGAGVVVYSNSTPKATLAAATTIFFPEGSHSNLKEYSYRGQSGSIINNNGKLTLQQNQNVYIEGGAFVEGYLYAPASWADGVPTVNGTKVYGRGVLSGRQYRWADCKPSTSDCKQLIQLRDDSSITGITYLEAPMHGVVAGKRTTMKNVKFMGWHANNDGVRIGEGSTVDRSFFRAVDDHFYNFNLTVRNSVLWAGHNGSILTYGWGGNISDEGVKDKTYNSGASLLENIDIINPEWTSLGNNQGIVMAQTGLDYKPFDYGTGSNTTTLRNIRIEGNITGLTNLKPRSSGDGESIAFQVPLADVGYLGDLRLVDITVDGMRNGSKSRIRGQRDAATDGNVTYYTKNIVFKNVKINGTCLSGTNKATFIDIEAATTQNITFEPCP